MMSKVFHEGLKMLFALFYMNPEIGLTPDHTTQNCAAVTSHSSIRSCNRVFHAATPEDCEVQEMKTFFQDTPFTWPVEATNTTLITILERNGLVFKGSFPLMTLDLTNVTDQAYVSDLIIQEIKFEERESIDCWVAVVTQVFNYQAEELLKVIGTLSKKIVPGMLRLYVGYVQENPVVSGMMIQHGELVTLHLIGTLSHYRKQGLGHAMTHKLLSDAKKCGCTEAALLSSAQGKTIYQKFGFQEKSCYQMYGN